MSKQNETLALMPSHAVTAIACVWAFMTALAFVGNLLVILSVLLAKKLRTVTNAFVVNLSVADLWSCLSYPWMIVAQVSPGGWPLASEVPCTVAALQFDTSLCVRVFTLAAVAVNRLVLTTVCRATYRRLYSPRKVIGMIATTWVVSCTIVFLPYVLEISEPGYYPEDKICSTKDGFHGRKFTYEIIESSCLVLSLTIAVISYAVLYARSVLQKRDQALRVDNQPHDEVVVTERRMFFLEISIRDATRQKITNPDQEQATTKILLIAFCIMLLLVLPFLIALVASADHKFVVYSMTIAILTSCVNPIIYAFGHPHFKAVLPKVARCRYSEILKPSYFLQAMLQPSSIALNKESSEPLA
ncbi:melatonin receptor type 1B-A-like [Acanthaster planci]|uniref:Melatonin receptor type 1B-A-like n=1 Tax=Acanthaster planci TaxID=133434 RepID=A0A8B7ZRH5_ACAPL|nr:melatonin receptor type 1B-A-like [Acanthaster planci]